MYICIFLNKNNSNLHYIKKLPLDTRTLNTYEKIVPMCFRSF